MWGIEDISKTQNLPKNPHRVAPISEFWEGSACSEYIHSIISDFWVSGIQSSSSSRSNAIHHRRFNIHFNEVHYKLACAIYYTISGACTEVQKTLCADTVDARVKV